MNILQVREYITCFESLWDQYHSISKEVHEVKLNQSADYAKYSLEIYDGNSAVCCSTYTRANMNMF